MQGQMCSSISSSSEPLPGYPTCAPTGTATHWLSTRTSCAALGGASCRPVPGRAGVPNELINVGKALGDLRLKGVQYTQIRVIVITHNYGVSAGEIIPKRTVAGPAQSPAKICSLNSSGICLPASLPPPSLPARVFSPAPVLPALPQQMPSLSHPSRRGTWHRWRRRGPAVASHSLGVRRIQEPSLTCLFF